MNSPNLRVDIQSCYASGALPYFVVKTLSRCDDALVKYQSLSVAAIELIKAHDECGPAFYNKERWLTALEQLREEISP